jgi:putative membrane protein
MRHWVRLGGAACVLALALTAAADDKKGDDRKNDETTKFTDANFVKTAFNSNMMESKLGEIGQLKGQSPQVKEFARRMVLDHGMNQNELRTAARAANIPVPDKMLPKHQKDVDKFENYKGDNFDKEYMDHMVKDHQKAVDLFTKAPKEAKNDPIQGYAEKSLPVLKQHLELAKRVQDQIKK